MITLNKLTEIAASQGNQTCIMYNNTSYSWNDIVHKTASCISFLRRTFSEEQLQSACYLSKNSADLICWLAALSTLGIPVNGLDYSLPIETLKMLIDRIKPGLLLVSFDLYIADELCKLNFDGTNMLAIEDIPTDFIVNSSDGVYHPELSNLLDGHISPNFRAISLTSGTSSMPKIALRYHSFDSRRFTWFIDRFSFNHTDGFMLILPLYHAAGNGWARMFMGLGATLYLVDQEDDIAIERILSNSQVHVTVMTPNLVSRMINIATRKKIYHYLRWVLVGGSYFSVKNKLAACNTFGDIFYEYYGCTETGVNVLSEPETIRNCPTSVGRPFDGNKVIIVDANHKPVKAKEKGRVAISSYMLMDEYDDRRKPFIMIDDDRYFLMADYGYIDEHGQLFLMNRNGEINSDYDIYRIEEKIRSLPCIKDVALLTIQVDGEKHIRCIFSTDQNSKDKFNQLVCKINEKAIAEGAIYFSAQRVDKIPYSPSGKVRFNEIINKSQMQMI